MDSCDYNKIINQRDKKERHYEKENCTYYYNNCFGSISADRMRSIACRGRYQDNSHRRDNDHGWGREYRAGDDYNPGMLFNRNDGRSQ